MSLEAFSIAGLSIGYPLGLLGLAAIPLILLGAWRSRLAMSRRLTMATTTLRVLAVILLSLALSDARIEWPSDDLAVTAIIDASQSISLGERDAHVAAVQAVRAAHPEVRFDYVSQVADSPSTELESQIDTAVAAMPSDRVRRILLVSDGRETEGDVLAAIARARAQGVTVSVLPAGDRPPIDRVSLEGIDVPHLVRAGEEASVEVRILASASAETQVEITIDGVRGASTTVTAPIGASHHALNVRFDREGVFALRAQIAASGDVVASNNFAQTLVRVVSPPRVLLVHELASGEPALASVLRDARLRVELVRAQGVPASASSLDPYQLVILDELELDTLNEAQRVAIRAWVEELGGGLVTVTGGHAVRREPDTLRDIEPLMPPRSIPEPRPMELLLVLDRSGSMQGQNILEARRAAVAAVQALRIDSRVGVVAFSDGADAVMATTTMDRAEDVTRFINRIYAGGGTEIGNALTASRRALSNDPRYIRHVILLSDGESDYQSAVAAASALASSGVTITAITIGAPNRVMQEIARIGRGRYHATTSARNLPSLFLREAQFRTPPPNRSVAFTPTITHAMPFLDGVDFTNEPRIGGYVLADKKDRATEILHHPDGPLLAHWFVGAGQVSSFASHTSGAWANAWRTGASFRRLFSQMAWDMLRPRADEEVDVHIEPNARVAGMASVHVIAASLRDRPTPLAELARAAGDAQPLSLTAAGPGVWRAEVPIERGFLIAARLPSSLDPTVAKAVDVAPDPERTTFGSHGPMLAAIAEGGGGKVLADPSAITEDVERAALPRAMRTELIVLALLAYVVGILLSRLPSRPRKRILGDGRSEAAKGDDAEPSPTKDNHSRIAA